MYKESIFMMTFEQRKKVVEIIHDNTAVFWEFGPQLKHPTLILNGKKQIIGSIPHDVMMRNF